MRPPRVVLLVTGSERALNAAFINTRLVVFVIVAMACNRKGYDIELLSEPTV